MDGYSLLSFKLLFERTAPIERVQSEIVNCIAFSTAMIILEVFCSELNVVNSEHAESDRSSAVVDLKLIFC